MKRPRNPDRALLRVLYRVWTRPVRLKSNFARQQAAAMAVAAERRLVTVHTFADNANHWQRTTVSPAWLIAPAGLALLWKAHTAQARSTATALKKAR